MHILIFGSSSLAIELAIHFSSSHQNNVHFVSSEDFSHLEAYHDIITHYFEDHLITKLSELNHANPFNTCLFLDQDEYKNFTLAQLATRQWQCKKTLYLTDSDLELYQQNLQSPLSPFNPRAISQNQLLIDALFEYFNHASFSPIHLTHLDIHVFIHSSTYFTKHHVSKSIFC